MIQRDIVKQFKRRQWPVCSELVLNEQMSKYWNSLWSGKGTWYQTFKKRIKNAVSRLKALVITHNRYQATELAKQGTPKG